MATPPKKKRPNVYGDSIPLSDAKELGENTGWALWNEAIEKTHRQFEHTAPQTAPHPPDGGDTRYAPTEPSALSSTREAPANPAPPKVTVEDVMVEARKNNRVCPKPTQWAALFGKFREWAPAGAHLPPPPLSGDSWQRTPPLAKRMAFRAHVEWAEEQQCLTQLLRFLRQLAEGEWQHMGD